MEGLGRSLCAGAQSPAPHRTVFLFTLAYASMRICPCQYGVVPFG
jgi:hypothetical protein